jgi:hypothetical protein
MQRQQRAALDLAEQRQREVAGDAEDLGGARAQGMEEAGRAAGGR